MKTIERFKGFVIKEYYEVTVLEGEGTEDSPLKEVHYLCNKYGNVISKI